MTAKRIKMHKNGGYVCAFKACGDYCVATTSRYVEILYFKHFYKHIVFTGEGDKFRNKVIKDYINVSVVIDIECGDTRDNNSET